MRKPYMPRRGSNADKALIVLKKHEGEKLSAGTLALAIGCRVVIIGDVLEHPISRGAIRVEARPATNGEPAGNWYWFGEFDMPDVATQPLMRTLPPSSVFDLGAPPRKVPVAFLVSKFQTTLAPVRFAVWTDGEIQIKRGRALVSLSPEEARELVELVASAKREAVAA